MSIAMQNGKFLKVVLWMLAALLLVAGLVIDHKYGGFRAPDTVQSSETRSLR